MQSRVPFQLSLTPKREDWTKSRSGPGFVFLVFRGFYIVEQGAQIAGYSLDQFGYLRKGSVLCVFACLVVE